MGNVLGNLVTRFAESLGLKAESRENARKEREWLENPDLRKLVPAPKCPHCKCRLDGMEADFSDSDTDIQPFKKVSKTKACKKTTNHTGSGQKCAVEVDVKGDSDYSEIDLDTKEKVALNSDYDEVQHEERFAEGIPSYVN